MDFRFNILFSLIELTLLFAPPFMVASFIMLRKRSRSILNVFTVCSAGILFTVFCFCYFDISFAKLSLNFILLSLVYVSYCFLAASCLRIQPIFFRVLCIIVAALPVCIGYVLSTVAVLGLMFIINDFTTTTSKMETMGPELTCIVSDWGMASNEGFSVNLYKTLMFTPFLKRKVASISVDLDDSETVPQPSSCDGMLAQYLSKP